MRRNVLKNIKFDAFRCKFYALSQKKVDENGHQLTPEEVAVLGSNVEFLDEDADEVWTRKHQNLIESDDFDAKLTSEIKILLRSVVKFWFSMLQDHRPAHGIWAAPRSGDAGAALGTVENIELKNIKTISKLMESEIRANSLNLILKYKRILKFFSIRNLVSWAILRSRFRIKISW